MAVLIHFVPNSLDLIDYVDNRQPVISNWLVEIFGLGMWDINDHWVLYWMVATVVGHLNTPSDKHLKMEAISSVRNRKGEQEPELTITN